MTRKQNPQKESQAMPYTRNNRRPMRPNVRHAETRRWALVRLPRTVLAIIDAEATKWRLTRSDALSRLVRKADAKTESGVRA